MLLQLGVASQAAAAFVKVLQPAPYFARMEDDPTVLGILQARDSTQKTM